MANKVKDLRSAIELLKTVPGQYIETDVSVDANAELSGVYRYIGSGGTVKRPTRIGPAMMFNTIKDMPGCRSVIGILSSRERVAMLLDTAPERLAFLLKDSVNTPIAPVVVGKDKAKCQEVVHLATDKDFDIRKIVPAPTNTPEDGGPYITMGLLRATHPVTGVTDVTIHRLCLHDNDVISVFFTPGARHIGAMYEAAEKLGKPLQVSVSIGLDPAVYISSGFEPPTTPLGYDELCIAGAIRGEAVELAKCLTIDETCIANAEYVIEGEIPPFVRVREDAPTCNGKGMPEFPGYTGPAAPQTPFIKIKAITHRKDPIMQTCIGPSEEHVSMAGIPTEASILGLVDKAMPGKLLNVYAHSSGGGKYLAILQFKKSVKSDEGRQRQAALLAFSAFQELKHVIVVDEDVDIFDSNDVLWAMNTRFQGNLDTTFIPGVRCHPLDPSSSPDYNVTIPDVGIACKTIFDCTVPFDAKEHFIRSNFKEMDAAKYAPELFKK